MDKLIKDIKELISFTVEKDAINEAERRIRFVISTDEIDRDNEKIEVSAVAAAIKDFAKNPVALAAHQHRSDTGTPTCIGHWDTDSFKASAHKSEMDLIFAETETAEAYWQLYKDKHMRAVSIGFRPLEWHEENDGKRKYSYIVFTKIELYEISACAVGANASALSKIKNFLNDDQKPAKEKNALLQAMCEIMHEDMNALGGLFNQLKSAMSKEFADTRIELSDLRAEIDELKDILTDSGKFAKLLLGGDNEPDEPAANNAERIAKGFETVLSKGKK